MPLANLREQTICPESWLCEFRVSNSINPEIWQVWIDNWIFCVCSIANSRQMFLSKRQRAKILLFKEQGKNHTGRRPGRPNACWGYTKRKEKRLFPVWRWRGGGRYRFPITAGLYNVQCTLRRKLLPPELPSFVNQRNQEYRLCPIEIWHQPIWK